MTLAGELEKYREEKIRLEGYLEELEEENEYCAAGEKSFYEKHITNVRSSLSYIICQIQSIKERIRLYDGGECDEYE